MTTSAIDKLSPKRQAFAREYAVDCNATQAAIRAGYAKSGASTQGMRLLANEDVGAAVQELQHELAADLKITREFLIETLWQNHKLALEGNPVLDRYGNPTGKYIKQLAASNKALDQIAEMLGLKVDKKQVTVREVKDMTAEELDEQERQLTAELERMKATAH